MVTIGNYLIKPVYLLEYSLEPALLSSPPKSTSLYALVIQLGAASQQIIPTINWGLHAQVMDWLSLGDTQIADAIYRSQDTPFSLSELMGYRRQRETQPGDDFTFRISLLDGDLIDPLLKGIEQWGNKPLFFGQCSFVIRNIYTLPGTHPLADSSDYAILANTDKISDEITLKFLSPTSFKQKREIQPFPLAELVFGSLLRRWNVFAPEELKFPFVEWKGLVSAYKLKTHAFKLESSSEIGAKGWVIYCFQEAEQAKIATTLAYFANFAGVGRKTAMGMGQTCLVNS
ncbi:CRISPR-associated endoribonuclease Cas6 [Nostoc sp.]|uniref:CRISPR-associated endoribonuclease Cas6 n=1 Tax=Nostoc sp. TaxID=1180 RepID=UPI002FFD33B0